jgi:predicted ATPase
VQTLNLPTALPWDVVLSHLQKLQGLLIFDSYEHLIPAELPFLLEIQHSCPGIALLITSRERLRLPSETLVEVPSLGIPHAVALLRYAGRMFPIEENDRTLATICQ